MKERSVTVTKTRRFPPRGGERVEIEWRTTVAKYDPSSQVVYGVVLDPYIIDAHDDWIPPCEVERTAHDYLVSSRLMRRQHSEDTAAEVVESFVFQYPTPEDYRKAMAGEPHRIWRMRYGTEALHSGSWVLGVRILDPALWEDVLSGELGAFSIGGFGVRTEMGRVPMPEVQVLSIEAPP